ncbi:MAG: S-methyl-5'-thioadenosine phosphorylase [Alicyclobacillus herbarius]|uniref:S-methyl-5'-thioadenosine phosphorylase n=1 Tax=Alicyclobacillus herbarius TaxID=122960 RepID=UPI0023549F11|nr:S-methyl-5'-thioadenosine phosphorylase [Alicyclobacillus herbarius]MCL6631439.1 S-methyl-5'-thioadenosine phosphorylase [Alicyclobacillus herbarius]
MQAKFAIIGGTGVYDPALLEAPETYQIETPFGTCEVTIGRFHDKSVAFIPRHGRGHQVPPHRINYRANLWALKEIGVEQVLATTAVGSLTREVEPGSFVIVDDFMDFTRSRPLTFFEQGKVVHIDMSDPYCARLRHHLRDKADQLGIAVHACGTYVCTDGPRFETAAEIRMYAALGGTVVGMTSVPEVVLAKECELCYATVCMVTNYGTGLSSTPLTHQEVVEQMAANVEKIRTWFFAVIDELDGPRTCACSHAVSGQGELTKGEN